MARWQLMALVLGLAGGLSGGEGPPAPLFPFVLPWDDASTGPTDVSAWLPRPAGQAGPVHAGADGHLYAGEKRIRFLGVNCCFDACFPRPADAPKIAARLAKFGVNVVRFHHMDMFAFPKGIRARNAEGTGELDPEALERLDAFTAALKAHGVYANLNLLVSRPFTRADGLPAEIEQVGWKERHAVGFFSPPARKPQEDYARRLLSHKNPHTGLTYAEDPAVAFIEINNENGLIHAWLGGEVDRLPAVFLADLQQQWNAWLRQRHGTTVGLRQAWGVQAQPLGEELLANPAFAGGLAGWTLERHGQAEAAAAPADDLPPALQAHNPAPRSVRIAVTRTDETRWHVQFNQGRLAVRADQPYTLRFWAKSDRPLTLTAQVAQNHAPYGGLGLAREVKLTPQWQEVRTVFRPTAADADARVNFSNLGAAPGTVWLAGVSLRPGGGAGLDEEEQLETAAVRRFERDRFGERTAAAQQDWMRFLWETEDGYWQAMQRFVKDELKVRGVVMGTIVGCCTPNLMARFDAVDTHAYWQHPHFPGRPWDPDNWTVGNQTMVNEPGGVLPGLALRRLAGRPHCVTEYNHTAPNTYGSEGFLLLAAYAALQDWDAIYAFAYAHGADWDAGRIQGFFDVGQHPTKMATFPAAAALFLRGDVRPAQQQLLAPLSLEREIALLPKAHAWDLVHAGQTGIPREATLVHRVALTLGDGPAPTPPRPTGPRFVSDTGELAWDLTRPGRGLVTVNTPRSKGAIGYAGGQRIDLGGVVLEPGATAQDGWCTLTVTAREGNLGGPGQFLVVATGTAENTGMRWKSPARDSVGHHWGRAPSLVEGIPARLTFPVDPGRVKAWALDERGQPRAPLPVGGAAGAAVIALGPEHRTLWYLVEVQ